MKLLFLSFSFAFFPAPHQKVLDFNDYTLKFIFLAKNYVSLYVTNTKDFKAS